jgi:FtsP/CotA-like multicopper oxidase with cupredoxin domain
MLLTGILFSTMMLTAPDRPGAVSKCSHLPRSEARRADPNDNETPAGSRDGSVMRVRLVVQAASWYPDGPDGCGIQVNAFAEEGKAPQIPGPLVRVRAGTELQIAIRNGLQKAIWVRGLRDQAEYARDSVEIAPGSTHEFRFRANGVGSFYYRARQLGNRGTQLSADIDGQLVGAFIVDPPEGEVADRVFVLTRWAQGDTAELKFELNAINGRSWPNTERLTLTVGDTVRWRVINVGNDFHMMHLHGFYFRILRGGVVGRDSVFPEERKRVVVTELLGPDGAFSLEWVPARAGNWIFHCHLARHMSASQRLDRMPGANGDDAASMHEDHTNHAMSAMAGLIVGLTVKPRPNAQLAAEPRSRRSLQLFANERGGVFGDRPGYGFVLQEGNTAPARDSVRLPGTPIVLTRGEPAQIVVHNRLSTPIAVHWHGIELESYSDGVAGWSGSTGHIAPSIAPGDSFVARMTPPRAGTFIYHVHGGHADQLVSGLYGPLVVLEPGRTFDPLADLLFVLSEPGPGSRLGDEKAPFVNGSASPSPVEMVAGRTYRLRFIGIPANDAYWTRLVSASGLQQWRLIARDGADVPADLAEAQPARFLAWAGITRDFEFTPTGPGELTLELNVANIIAGRLSGRITKVPIRVRER